MIFHIENNGYAISVPLSEQTSGESIYSMTSGYENLDRISIDGTNYFESVLAFNKAIDRARRGKGPTVIESSVVRLLPHSSSDDHRKYRSEEEIENDKLRDPIEQFKILCIDKGIIKDREFDKLKKLKLVDCSFCGSLDVNKSLMAPNLSKTKKVKEIVITGVNIGDFGLHNGESLIQLLREMDELEHIERIRISSIEPNLLSDEIIEFCNGSKKFMPHFHIPLQSGSDRILKLMRRRYNTDYYQALIEKIKNINKDTLMNILSINLIFFKSISIFLFINEILFFI